MRFSVDGGPRDQLKLELTDWSNIELVTAYGLDLINSTANYRGKRYLSLENIVEFPEQIFISLIAHKRKGGQFEFQYQQIDNTAVD